MTRVIKGFKSLLNEIATGVGLIKMYIQYRGALFEKEIVCYVDGEVRHLIRSNNQYDLDQVN